MTFDDLGLHPDILRAVREVGYSDPTPIQASAIPYALKGRDIVGRAQTGTGKTAAFLLPILDRLHGEHVAARQSGADAPPSALRALVLVPTRELALQVDENCRAYGRTTGIRCGVVYGGVGYGAQNEAFQKGVEIIIATPGRLLDHIGRGNVDPRRCSFLVLDEADRMLDMGFAPDIDRILKVLPKDRQTFLFSATIPPQIESLARTTTRRAVKIEVGLRAAPVEGVTHYVHHVPRHKKGLALLHFCRAHRGRPVLVFVRTRRDAERIGKALLHEGFSSARIHSDRTQKDREKAMSSFREGKADVLVATDIASRGIDVEGIALVVNHDVPEEPEVYIHRIGRTARAGDQGEAVTFVAPDEIPLLHAVESLLGSPIEIRELPPEAYDDMHLPGSGRRGAPRPSGRSSGRSAPSLPRTGEEAPPPPAGRAQESSTPEVQTMTMEEPLPAPSTETGITGLSAGTVPAEHAPPAPEPGAPVAGTATGVAEHAPRPATSAPTAEASGASPAPGSSPGDGTASPGRKRRRRRRRRGKGPDAAVLASAGPNGANGAVAAASATATGNGNGDGGEEDALDDSSAPNGNRADYDPFAPVKREGKKVIDGYGRPVHRNTHTVLDDDAWKRHLHTRLEKDARKRGEPIPETTANRAKPNERPWLLKKKRRR